MTVQEAIDILMDVTDKTLPIRLSIDAEDSYNEEISDIQERGTEVLIYN